MNNAMSGILEIASALIGVAMIALIINKSDNTTQVIKAGGSTFNDLLKTFTLQNGFSTY